MLYVAGILSLFAILASCELFTNSIEWTGKKFNFNKGVTGSILAAVGTALPETIVPIIAILFFKEKSGAEIGIGAILGAPLMLSTLAFGITGLAVIFFHMKDKKRTLEIKVNEKILSNDMFFFLVVYVLAFMFSFFPIWAKKSFGIIFILIYGLYVYRTFKHGRDDEEDHLEVLYFGMTKKPAMWQVLLQDFAALAGIVLGARFFVVSIQGIAAQFHIDPFIFALFVAPIATELPEKFNSIIWVGKKKDTLALGNISGAMVFQSSIVVFVGVVGTDWILNARAVASVFVTLASTFVIMAYMKIVKKLNAFVLLSGILFYLFYIYLVVSVVKTTHG